MQNLILNKTVNVYLEFGKFQNIKIKTKFILVGKPLKLKYEN